MKKKKKIKLKKEKTKTHWYNHKQKRFIGKVQGKLIDHSIRQHSGNSCLTAFCEPHTSCMWGDGRPLFLTPASLHLCFTGTFPLQTDFLPLVTCDNGCHLWICHGLTGPHPESFVEFLSFDPSTEEGKNLTRLAWIRCSRSCEMVAKHHWTQTC